MSTPQQQVSALSQKFQQIQSALQSAVEARQRLESQSQENQSVKAEFEALEEDAAIYKLIGPVLVKQDATESMQNVNRRIELLAEETKRIEEEVKRYQREAEGIKNEIVGIQQAAQAQEAEA